MLPCAVHLPDPCRAPATLPALRHRRNVHAGHVLLKVPLLSLQQLPVRVQLKVHHLAARQRHRHLVHVACSTLDLAAAGGAPLVDAPAGSDVAQAARVHLLAIRQR